MINLGEPLQRSPSDKGKQLSIIMMLPSGEWGAFIILQDAELCSLKYLGKYVLVRSVPV